VVPVSETENVERVLVAVGVPWVCRLEFPPETVYVYVFISYTPCAGILSSPSPLPLPSSGLPSSGLLGGTKQVNF